ncbi:MAG: hypothetical protein HY282_13100 [Nitrospirae bacterium]|nr:hypothetical protein [Candidatus Manganitrophaceae bacterium]
MRQLFRHKRLTSSFLTRWSALGLIGAALLFLASLTGSIGTGLTISKIADCVRHSTPAEQRRCFAPVAQDAVRSGKTAALLQMLAAMVRSETLDDCHPLAHDLGQASFEARKNLLRAMHEGDASCHKGYYHGVVAAAVHHAASLGQLDIVNLCADLRKEALAYDACLHGLGHGLMHLSDNIVAAQQPCASLPDAYARRRCVDGLWMENAMQYLHLDPAEYRLSAPRGCDRFPLPPGPFEACYGAIGEIALFYYRHHLSAALEICYAVESRPGRERCERGAREEFKAWQQERPQSPF